MFEILEIFNDIRNIFVWKHRRESLLLPYLQESHFEDKSSLSLLLLLEKKFYGGEIKFFRSKVKFIPEKFYFETTDRAERLLDEGNKSAQLAKTYYQLLN